MKRMLKPHLMQTRADDRWHCIWELTESGNSLAYVESPDLLQWKAQKYFDRSRLAEYRPAEVYPNVRKEVLLNGTVQQGWMQRVPYATVQRVISFAEHKKYRQALHAERTEQDPVRFAGLKPVEATIEVETECAKTISKHLIGIFFEDINYAADGGLYAELVQNRDFEYSSKDGSHQGWDGTYAWAVKEGNTSAAVTIAAADPIHPNNPHYAVLEARPGVTLQNDGFDGISLKKGEKYDFSLFARVAPGSKGGKVVVCLLDQTGREIARSSVNVSSKEWKKQQTVLTANADVRAAVLSLQPQTVGTLHLDMISLFPQNTFKGHKNGLRADLAQTLADLHPRFVRFPGGCVAHGDGIDNIYDWKGSIGPLEARKPLRNLWGVSSDTRTGLLRVLPLLRRYRCRTSAGIGSGRAVPEFGHTLALCRQLSAGGQQGTDALRPAGWHPDGRDACLYPGCARPDRVCQRRCTPHRVGQEAC